MLAYQVDQETGEARYLRSPQLRALEVYWYLRLIEGTPRIADLYVRFRARGLYAKKQELVDALGIPGAAWEEVDTEIDNLFAAIETDDDFVRRYKLQTVREALALAYPSYILALAMGAGKTVLIGAIIATEFSLALEYPRAAGETTATFVENALVFAPGKTILGSLRELAAMPYDRILPPRLYATFAPNLKLTFTRDGEKDLPIIRGSSFNVVVTNTDKIRIQKESIKSSLYKGLFAGLKGKEDEARALVANLRLQAIASLPQLAVFSDEAHHTYGQELGKELKRVRQTVDYLAQQTSLACVINTTGTPYFEKQALKDVVTWYGLGEGIAEGILKEVAEGIHAYRFSAADAAGFVAEVVRDFFTRYRDVRLPNGAQAKIALYFPQTDDLEDLRPAIERTLNDLGLDPASILTNTMRSSTAEQAAFDRLNDPDAPQRVILLVNKGTEGWNCPSLFACALVRKLTSSRNFVLQAATRCLRQVPGNNVGASIYLSDDNRKALDAQLQETYGQETSLGSLTGQKAKSPTAILTLRKPAVPPLILRVPVSVVRRKVAQQGLLLGPPLTRPTSAIAGIERINYRLAEGAGAQSLLTAEGVPVTVEATGDLLDLYTAATELAAVYRLAALPLYKALQGLYPEGEIAREHLWGAGDNSLAAQLERSCCDYERTTEIVEMTLALVKAAGWRAPDGAYTATATVPKEELLVQLRASSENPRDFGYHYAPYKFASEPERDFFLDLLNLLQRPVLAERVEDVYFTGGTIDEKKTDFFVEYTDTSGKHHRYVPDFIIRKRPSGEGAPGTGPSLIVEIKSSQQRETIAAQVKAGDLAGATTDEARKALATLHWVDLNRGPSGDEGLRYELIFDNETPLLAERVRRFIEEQAG